jgi:hypothetical protein
MQDSIEKDPEELWHTTTETHKTNIVMIIPCMSILTLSTRKVSPLDKHHYFDTEQEDNVQKGQIAEKCHSRRVKR